MQSFEAPSWLLPTENEIEVYQRLGWKLIPVPKGSKAPVHKGWNRLENCQLPENWEGNIGLALAYSGIVSIDIDHWLKATQWLKQRGIDLQELYISPDAVTIISGKEGHGKILYKLPEGIEPLESQVINDNSRQCILEFRSTTQEGKTVQDLVFPSTHPETQKPYQWGLPEGGDLYDYLNGMPELPTSLLTIWNELIGDRVPACKPTANRLDTNWQEIEQALGFISADCTRDVWVRIGMALHNYADHLGYLEQGLAVWDEWSQTAPDKYEGDTFKQWESFKSDKNNGITIATLFDMAIKEGYKPNVDVSSLFESLNSKDPSMSRYTLLDADSVLSLPRTAWRIKDIIPETGIAAIYGPSGSGKSFLAIDMALSIAKGEKWFDNKVKPCPVVYITLEGESGLSNRLAAYKRHCGSIDGNVKFILGKPLNMLEPTDISVLYDDLIKEEMIGGVVIIDTLNRAAPGMDENSSSDMGHVIQSAKLLQSELNGMIILVHHTGKDASKGLRGHSSLNAALDATIEVTRKGEQRIWTISKAKDGEDGKKFPFDLNVVDLGIDDDNDLISSCVIQPLSNTILNNKETKAPKGVNQKIVLDRIKELLQSPIYHQNEKPKIDLKVAIDLIKDDLDVEPKRCVERTRQAIIGLVSNGVLQNEKGQLSIQ